MNKNQPITVGILRQVLARELGKNNEFLKQELRKEIKDNGEGIKRELKREFKLELKKGLEKQEERIGRHLDAVYGDFESKQAIMAENVIGLYDKVSSVQIDVINIKDKLDLLSGRVFFSEQKMNPAC